MKYLLLTSLLLAFLCVQCTSEKNDELAEFSGLSPADSARWHAELLEAIHAEMVDSVEHYFLEEMPVFCGEPRSTTTIQISGDSIHIRNYGTDVRSALFAHYFTNRKENDVTNNHPLYTHLSEKEIQAGLKSAKNELNEAKKLSDNSALIDYHQLVVNEWEERLIAIKTLKIDMLPEIHGQAYIKIYGRNANPETKRKLFDEIVEMYCAMREEIAQEYFHKSYLELFYLAHTRKKQVDLNRMKAISILLPTKIEDTEYCKAHKCCGYSIPEPPPPPEPEPDLIDYPENDPILLLDSLNEGF